MSKHKRMIPAECRPDIARYFLAGVPMQTLADAYGVSRQAIHYHLRKLGISRSNTEIVGNAIGTLKGCVEHIQFMQVQFEAEKIRRRKDAARTKVAGAIRSGELNVQPCEVCGILKDEAGRRVEAHHDDYDKPLDVRWLCPLHHAAWHKQQGHRHLNHTGRQPKTTEEEP